MVEFGNARRVVAAALIILAGAAAPARADWLFTPYIGLVFGGDARNERVTYGGSLTWMSRGIVGIELDGALAANLFSPDDESLALSLGDDKVGTAMANLIIGAPLGEPGLRPYASAGAGLIQLSVDNPLDTFDVTENSFGVNVGAGVVGFVGDRLGLRADVRYFRRLQDSDSSAEINLGLGRLNFWRTTLGLSIRF